MQIEFLPHKLKYSGDQLHGLFAYKHLKTTEDSLIAFLGEAHVSEHLVDLEDKLAGDHIYAKEMLHWILTIHGNDLTSARLWQLLLTQVVYSTLMNFVTHKNGPTHTFKIATITDIYRDGDDIFVVENGKHYKMSVSIATVTSNQKEVVHFAINVLDEGAPVPTHSLDKLYVLPTVFAGEVLRRFKAEYDGVQKSLYKVAGVN